MYCYNKCCNLKITPYINQSINHIEKTSNKKAGVFMFDPDKNKILIVQSRGNLWGMPKGTFEKNEDSITCAIRELYEETGLEIDKNELTKYLLIKDCATYFYIKKAECPVQIQENVLNNDANGIGWINITCLKEMLSNGDLKINHHCRICFKHFLNITLPTSK